MSESYDYKFSVVIIGDAPSGKSCLINHFKEGKFKDDNRATICPELILRTVNVVGKSVKLQIWDTSGVERFHSIRQSYYRGVCGAILVYDITSRKTFNNLLTTWINDFRTQAKPNVCILLVGNKKDLDSRREVTFEEASTFAQENKLIFIETSAKTGENVEKAFLMCTRMIIAKIESGEPKPNEAKRNGCGIQ